MVTWYYYYAINFNPKLIFFLKIEIASFHSAYGNNQFTQLPFKLNPTTFCEGMNIYYRKYLMEELVAPISDLPFSKKSDTDLCTLFTPVWYKTFNQKKKLFFIDIHFVFKKKYTITNYIFDESRVPKIASNGLYKMVLSIKNGNKVVNGLIVVASLSWVLIL